MEPQDEMISTFADDEETSKLVTYLMNQYHLVSIKDKILEAVRFAEKCYIKDDANDLICDSREQLKFSLTVAKTIIDVFEWKSYRAAVPAIFHDVLWYCDDEEKGKRSSEILARFGSIGQTLVIKMMDWYPKKSDGEGPTFFPKVLGTPKSMLFVLMAREYVKLNSMCEYVECLETRDLIQSHAVFTCMLAQEIYALLPPVYKRSLGSGFHLIHPVFETLFQKVFAVESGSGEIYEFTVLPTDVSCMQVFYDNKFNVEAMI